MSKKRRFRSLVIRNDVMEALEQYVDINDERPGHVEICNALHWLNRSGVPGLIEDSEPVKFECLKEIYQKAIEWLDKAQKAVNLVAFGKTVKSVKGKVAWASESLY